MRSPRTALLGFLLLVLPGGERRQVAVTIEPHPDGSFTRTIRLWMSKDEELPRRPSGRRGRRTERPLPAHAGGAGTGGSSMRPVRSAPYFAARAGTRSSSMRER